MLARKVTNPSYPRYAKYDSFIPALVTMGWEYEIDNPDVYNGELYRQEVDRIKAKVGPEFLFCCDGGGTRTHGGYSTYGVEVRSPVGPLFLAKAWAEKTKPFTLCNKNVSGNNNGGGIHVNISKNAFTKAQWSKVQHFMHDKTHFVTFHKLSNRTHQQFRSYAPQLGYVGGEKYGIITAQKRYAYELRMFGAHPDVFIPSLEFSDALFRFAAGVKEIKLDEFFTWVDKNPKYEELSKYINKVL